MRVKDDKDSFAFSLKDVFNTPLPLAATRPVAQIRPERGRHVNFYGLVHISARFYLSRVEYVEDLCDNCVALGFLRLLTQDLDVSQLAEVEVALLLQALEIQSHIHKLTRQLFNLLIRYVARWFRGGEA